MAVTIGSARSDERGKITGGKSGDQKSGKEVSTQAWYKHAKGWRVLRCTVPALRIYIAEAMKMACANDNIGYDQYQRNTLYNLVYAKDFDPSKATTKVETDCSALVCVCVLYALRKGGIDVSVPNFNTSSEVNTLLKTGYFKELKGSEYTSKSDRLAAGDILCTKTKGHTVIVITSGDKADDTVVEKVYSLGDRVLRNGMEGKDVKELQSRLIDLGYGCGKWGADGDFGDATELAVENFQRDHNCGIDGEVGEETLKALEKALGVDKGDGDPISPKTVKIVNGRCYVRDEPNTNGKKLGVAYEYDTFDYDGETSADGWNSIRFRNRKGYVSGKYSKLV